MKPMDTKKLVQMVVFWTAISLGWADAEPFRLTETGVVGTSDEGLGMPLRDMRAQLDRFWAAGNILRFYAAGRDLCDALQQSKTLYDSITAQDYIDTGLYVLDHPNTTDKVPYPAIVLVSKATVGELMLGGDYIYYYFGGAEYRKNRTDVLDAGISLMNALRKEQLAKPVVLPAVTADPRKRGLSEEEKAAAFKLLRREEDVMLTASLAVIRQKDIPVCLQRIEKSFASFAEQEYRRIPPEKGEIEKIVERAGLPKDAAERLKKLIPQ